MNNQGSAFTKLALNDSKDDENINQDNQIASTPMDQNLPLFEDSVEAWKEYNEGDLKEETIGNSNANSFQKSNDYVNYGLDYEGVQQDPRKVDVELPLMDYVLQLLCNPRWTNEIFKQKMLDYQYHLDKPLDREISQIQNAIK